MVRFTASEGAGQKSVSFQVPAPLAAPTSLVVQSFDTLDVLEQGTVTLPASSGGGCTYAIGPTPQVFGAGGGTSLVNVTTGSSCAWTATSNAAWVVMTPPVSGTGSSSVGFTVAANTGAARTGTATVAGQTLTISQAAVPAPTATLTASPTSITAGGSATLTWATTNAATVSIDQGIGTVTASGSRTVSPSATTTYTLTASNVSGTVTATTTVTVTPVVPPPTATLSLTPSTITSGSSATLSWTTTNATTVSIDQGIGAVAVSGSRAVSPTVTTTYTLTASGSGGTVTTTATLTVNPVVPAPTATLSASPTSITAGGSATLTWSTTNATLISIDQGIGTVATSGSRTVNPSASTTYTLTASNGTTTATSTATVTVTGASSGNRSSLAFNGTNAQARFTTLPALSTFTVEAWVKRTTVKGQYETFVSNASNGYGQETFGLYVDGGNADCGTSPSNQFAWAYTMSGGGWFWQCSGVAATLNTWFHVAVSRDSAGTARIFINGVLRATQANAPAPTSSTGALGVGLAGDAVTEYFAGRVDEVRISSSSRYTASFAPPLANFASDASTVALYHFDEGTGQTVSDASPNNRSGVLGVSPAVETIDPAWSTDVPFP